MTGADVTGNRRKVRALITDVDVSRRGAYGLHLPDIREPSLLVAAPQTWPTWRFSWSKELPESTQEPYRWSSQMAELGVLPSGRARIDRAASTTTLQLPEPFSEQALVHPHLGSTAAAVALWNGQAALHGGSFQHGPGVWAVLGSREAGKSSVLAWCLTQSLPIVADDLLITDGRDVRCGPRIIDLRASAARQFGLGTDVGVLGSRRRWRVALGMLPAQLPLLGWIELAWGDRVEVERIPVSERMPVLLANRALALPVTTDRDSLLRLLGLHAVRLTRPKDWAQHDKAMLLLLDQLATRAAY